jgi:hypothetical protein
MRARARPPTRKSDAVVAPDQPPHGKEVERWQPPYGDEAPDARVVLRPRDAEGDGAHLPAPGEHRHPWQNDGDHAVPGGEVGALARAGGGRT